MKRWILALVFFWGIATALWIGVPAIATEEEATEPHDHIVTAWVGSDSNHSGSCNLCGEIITQSHKLDSGSVTTPATCQGPGIMTYACTLCDYTSTTEIPATSHSYGSWSKVDSTYHQHSCACGATVTEKHTWNNGVVTTKATCSRTGVRRLRRYQNRRNRQAGSHIFQFLRCHLQRLRCHPSHRTQI